jgi:hypothetical protein
MLMLLPCPEVEREVEEEDLLSGLWEKRAWCPVRDSSNAVLDPCGILIHQYLATGLFHLG